MKTKYDSIWSSGLIFWIFITNIIVEATVPDFYYSKTEWQDWMHAKVKCENRNMELAMLDTKEKYEAAKMFIKSEEQLTRWQSINLMIGLSRDTTDTHTPFTYRYTNGLSPTYLPWTTTDQPNDPLSRNCIVLLISDSSSGFATEHCKSYKRYLCTSFTGNHSSQQPYTNKCDTTTTQTDLVTFPDHDSTRETKHDSTKQPTTTEHIGTTTQPTTTEHTGTTTQPTTTEHIRTTTQRTTTEHIGTTTQPTTTEHIGTTTQPTTTEHIGTTIQPTTTEHIGTTTQPTTTEHIGTTTQPTTTEHIGTTRQPTTTEHIGTTTQPTTTEHIGTTTQPTTTEHIGTTTQPTTTEHIGTTTQPTTTEHIGTTTQPTTLEHIGTTTQPTTTEHIGTTTQPTTTEHIGTTTQPTTTEHIGTTTQPITTESNYTTLTHYDKTTTKKVDTTPEPAQYGGLLDCLCPCSNYTNKWLHLLGRNYTLAELKQIMQPYFNEMTDKLKVGYKNTSKYRRSLTSAIDSRKSSVAMGTVGIVVLSLIGCLIVTLDCANVVKGCRQSYSKRRKNVVGMKDI